MFFFISFLFSLQTLTVAHQESHQQYNHCDDNETNTTNVHEQPRAILIELEKEKNEK
jgi:hypothetical protein